MIRQTPILRLHKKRGHLLSLYTVFVMNENFELHFHSELLEKVDLNSSPIDYIITSVTEKNT